jgi:GntR family transcriptional regulator / MocR family aminotransferase
MPKDVSTFELSLGDRESASSLHAWLCGEIRKAVLEGRLTSGERLPASRDLASQYGISRGTVVAAYEQLQAEGYLISRVGDGTRVQVHLPPAPPAPPRAPVRMRSAAMAGLPHPRPAMPFRVHEPDLDTFPVALWARLAARRLRTAGSALLAGGGVIGYPPLREAIAAYLANSRGVRCDPDQVVVASGVQQALDLLARFLFQPGDRVLVEDPGYFGAVLAFRNCGLRVVPGELDARGQRVPSAAAAVKGAYVTPGHQFPLGMTMPLDRRLELLEWARLRDAWILEDDYDSEYRFEGKPVAALQGLDRAGRVIFLGTFNKLLFPALRIGYFVLPHSLVDRFRAFRYATDLQCSALDQAVLCDFIVEGHLSRHLRRTRDLYGSRLDSLFAASRRHLKGLFDLSPVRAGLSTSAILRSDHGINSAQAEAAAAARGVESLGLHRFKIGNSGGPEGLLLGFAAFPEKRIESAVRELAAAI